MIALSSITKSTLHARIHHCFVPWVLMPERESRLHMPLDMTLLIYLALINADAFGRFFRVCPPDYNREPT